MLHLVKYCSRNDARTKTKQLLGRIRRDSISSRETRDGGIIIVICINKIKSIFNESNKEPPKVSDVFLLFYFVFFRAVMSTATWRYSRTSRRPFCVPLVAQLQGDHRIERGRPDVPQSSRVYVPTSSEGRSLLLSLALLCFCIFCAVFFIFETNYFSFFKPPPHLIVDGSVFDF